MNRFIRLTSSAQTSCFALGIGDSSMLRPSSIRVVDFSESSLSPNIWQQSQKFDRTFGFAATLSVVLLALLKDQLGEDTNEKHVADTNFRDDEGIIATHENTANTGRLNP